MKLILTYYCSYIGLTVFGMSRYGRWVEDDVQAKVWALLLHSNVFNNKVVSRHAPEKK
ncbi:MAG: hypothetical protein ABI045_00795 [Flavobacteriales bacterium]